MAADPGGPADPEPLAAEVSRLLDRLQLEDDESKHKAIIREWYGEVASRRSGQDANLARIFFDVLLGKCTERSTLKSQLAEARTRLEEQEAKPESGFKKGVWYPVLATVILAVLGFVGLQLKSCFDPPQAYVRISKIELQGVGGAAGRGPAADAFADRLGLDLAVDDMLLRSWERATLAEIYGTEPVKLPRRWSQIAFTLSAGPPAGGPPRRYEGAKSLSSRGESGSCLLILSEADEVSEGDLGVPPSARVHFVVTREQLE